MTLQQQKAAAKDTLPPPHRCACDMRSAHLVPAHELEAVWRLCNTDSTQSRATDTSP
jgi:hypothetical protein